MVEIKELVVGVVVVMEVLHGKQFLMVKVVKRKKEGKNKREIIKRKGIE
jgi:hypothetical protein